MTATIITRAGKGSLLTVPEMDQNFKNLNEQILRTDSRNPLMPAFRSDFANSGMVDPRINFSRNSTATYFDKYGVMRTAKAGEPRIDYDPVTGECKGLLIEESRTNLLTYSEQFGNWSKQSIISLQEDQMLSPKATMSADLLNGGYIYQRLSGVNPSNNIYTFSVWIYSTAIGTIKTGIASWGGVEYQQQNSISANTWTRVIQTATFGSSSGDLHPKIYTDSPISFYIWGAQLEAGSTATSYIPTTTAAVTRAADTLSIAPSRFSSVTNKATVIVKAKPAVLFTNQTLYSLATDNTSIVQTLNKKTQSKNLLTQSENFSLSPWTLANATITQSTQINPLTDTKTVWKLIDNTTSATHYVYYNLTSGVTINNPYTYSVYVKADGRNFFAMRWNNDSARGAVFNLSTGTIDSFGASTAPTIRNIGNGWYRCGITVKPTMVSSSIYFYTSANNTLASYAGDNVSGTLLYGAQLEAEEKPTKYIPEPAYAFDLNSIQSASYQSVQDFAKLDTYGTSINSTGVSYAANGKHIGTTTKSTSQISTLYLGSDVSGLNQFNGHISKISIYPDESTTEQLISMTL
jgi:hypothetical protein